LEQSKALTSGVKRRKSSNDRRRLVGWKGQDGTRHERGRRRRKGFRRAAQKQMSVAELRPSSILWGYFAAPRLLEVPLI
jgi:hypothetical protein